MPSPSTSNPDLAVCAEIATDGIERINTQIATLERLLDPFMSRPGDTPATYMEVLRNLRTIKEQCDLTMASIAAVAVERSVLSQRKAAQGMGRHRNTLQRQMAGRRSGRTEGVDTDEPPF